MNAWFKQSADLDCAVGLCSYGLAYLRGRGVAKNETQGLVLIAEAAARGSMHACYVLGWAHMKGKYGLDEDPEKVARRFRQMEGCELNDTPKKNVDEAANWLLQHAGGS